ncbi:MAG: hypothetical protein AAB701_00615 [Patescibacteria group bacterium]
MDLNQFYAVAFNKTLRSLLEDFDDAVQEVMGMLRTDCNPNLPVQCFNITPYLTDYYEQAMKYQGLEMRSYQLFEPVTRKLDLPMVVTVSLTMEFRCHNDVWPKDEVTIGIGAHIQLQTDASRKLNGGLLIGLPKDFDLHMQPQRRVAIGSSARFTAALSQPVPA